jgi:VCBS repeat-containing protein
MAKFTFRNKTTGESETIQVKGEVVLEESRILTIDETSKPVTVPAAAVFQEGDDLVYVFVDDSTLRLRRVFILMAEGKLGQGFIDNLQAPTDVEAVDVSSDGSDSTDDGGLGNLGELNSKQADSQDSRHDADPVITPPLATVPVVPLVAPVPPVVPPVPPLLALPDIVPDPLNPAPLPANDDPIFPNSVTLDFTNTLSPSLVVSGQLFDSRFNLNDSALLPVPRDRYFNDRNDFRVGGPPEAVIVRTLTSDDDGLKNADLAGNKLPVTVTDPVPGSGTLTEPFGTLGIQGIYGELSVLRSSGTYTYRITGTPQDTPAPGDPIPPALTPQQQLANLQETVEDLRSGQFLADFFRYEVQDPANISSGELTVRILGKNDAPTTAADTATALERATAPAGAVFLPASATDPAQRSVTTLSGNTASSATRITGILGNDTDVEPLLTSTLLPSFRYVATVADFSTFTHDGARQVEEAIYHNSANPNALQDNTAQKWAVSGLFTNLANGTGGTGFGNFSTDPDVTRFDIHGRFGTLRLFAGGSWRYLPDSGVTIPVNGEDAFQVKLFDLATDSNKASGALAGNGTTTTLGFDNPASPFHIAGDVIRITAADVTAAVGGEPAGSVSKAIPSGHAPFNVTTLDFPADPGGAAAVDSAPGTLGGTLTIDGRFGTLVVTKADGTYTYTVHENNPTVDALRNTAGTRQTLTEVFGYTMADENPFDAPAGAIQRTSTLTVTIQGSNDSPVFTLNPATLAQTTAEDVTVVLTSTQLNAVDVDDDTTGLFYKVTTAPAHGTLVHSGVGDLAVNSVFSQADLNAGLISYRPNADYFSGDISVPVTPADSFRVDLNDGGEDGSITQNFGVTLTVRPVNDAPTASAPANAQTFLEVAPPGLAATSLFTAGVFAGSSASTGPANEFAQRITELRFTISNVQSGGPDHLQIDGSDVTLTPGFNVAATAGNGYNVTVGGAGSDLTFTVTGVLTTAQVESLLNTLSFRNLSEDPLTAGRVLTLTRITDNGATGDPGVDFSNPNASTTISVVNVNDAPRFSGGILPTLVAGNFTENAIPAASAVAIDLFNGGTLDLVESVNTLDRVSTIQLLITGVPTGPAATPAQDGLFEKLVVGGTDVSLQAGTTLAAGGMTATVTADGANLRVTLTGNVSAASASALIDGLGYRNTSDDPVAGPRSITLVSVQDNGGTANSGADTGVFNITKTFDVVAVNDRPVAAATTPDTTYTEGEAAIPVFTAAVTDPIEQLQTFTQMVLRISGVQNGTAEVLTLGGIALPLQPTAATALTGFGSVVISPDGAGAFLLTVTDTDNLSAVEANSLLNGLRYQNTSDSPLAGDRLISLHSLTDSGPGVLPDINTSLPGALFTTIVTVVPVNDTPTLTGLTGSVNALTENDPATLLFSGAAVDSVENLPADQLINNITFKITGAIDGTSEQLIVNGTAVPLTAGTAVNIGGGETANVSADAGPGNFTIGVSGSLTDAEASNLINGLRYQHLSDDPDPLAGTRTITVVSITDNGGGTPLDILTVPPGVTATVTVTPVDDAPRSGALITAANPAYLENGDSATVFTSAAITTVESAQQITSLRFTVTGVVDGAAEEMAFPGGITVPLIAGGPFALSAGSLTITEAAGTLTLVVTGALSNAQASSIVNGMAYAHTSVDPTGGNRVVTLTQITDSGGAGFNTLNPALASTITVTPVNNVPTAGAIAAAIGAAATFSEGSATPADVFNGAAVNTVESGQSINRIVLTVSNVLQDAAERLVINGTEVPIATNPGGTAIGTLTASVSLDAGTATVTISGLQSAGDASTLLNTLTYRHTSTTLASGSRTVTLVSVRDTGGTGNGGTDQVLPGTAATITLLSVNNAPAAGPILAAAGPAATFLENAIAGADLFNNAVVDTIETGDTINQIILTVTNVEDDSAERLVINGTEVLLADNVAGTAVGALTASVALAAGTATITITGNQSAADASNLLNTLTYRQDSETLPSGTREVTLVSLRDSGGTANGGADTVSPALTSTVTVTTVNDAPITGPLVAAAAPAAIFVENAVAGADLFNAAAIGTVESADTIDQIILTVNNVADGSAERLVINGTEVLLANNVPGTAVGTLNASVALAGSTATITITGSQTAAQASTLLNDLTYRHNSETLPSGTRDVTLNSIRDSGGTANGGVDLLAVNLTAAVTLTAVNDAPILAAGGAAPTFDQSGTPPGGTPVILDATMTINDVELHALNGGLGDYSGAVLTVARDGGALATDVFSFPAAFGGLVNDTVATTLSLGGNIVADYTLGAGTLSVTFLTTAGAIPTQAIVESVVHSVRYANEDTALIGAPQEVIHFALSDGNAPGNAQGTGGTLIGAANVSVNLIAPVAIDLHHDGIHFVQANDAHALSFDLNGDGIADHSAWVASGDGILVHDADQNGLVTDRSEFVFTDTGHGATDLAALAHSYDSNHDSMLTPADTSWADFKIWHDVNGDLTFGRDELVSLDSMGIVSLSLTGHGEPDAAGNVLVHQTGSVQFADGTHGELADATFAFSHGLPPADEVLHNTPEIPLPPAPLPPPAAPPAAADAALAHADAPAPPDAGAAVPDAPAAVPPPPPHEEVQPHAVV